MALSSRECVTSILASLGVLTAAGTMVMCTQKAPDIGGVMLEILDDGSLAIEKLHIEITSGDGQRVLMNNDFSIPSEARLPNTIDIASNGDPTATVSLAVLAYGGGVALDRRDHIVTQIPTDRVVGLRVVLSA